eukprot:gene9119-11588_t
MGATALLPAVQLVADAGRSMRRKKRRLNTRKTVLGSQNMRLSDPRCGGRGGEGVESTLENLAGLSPLLAWADEQAHVARMPKPPRRLTRTAVVRALTRLGELCEERKSRVEIAIYGGTVMMLAYDCRG